MGTISVSGRSGRVESGSSRRIVCYSVTFPVDVSRPDLLWQLEASIRSLRAHNRSSQVVVFVHHPVPDELFSRVEPLGVRIVLQPTYEARLAALQPRASESLSRYPLLHKFLNFSEISAMSPSQVLLLDCDTIFCGDVDRIFDAYGDAHCVAREEPTCSRSHYGYDPAYLDETLLAHLARSQGVHPPPPFNLGVVMLNHDVWSHLANLAPVLVDLAWRFQVWMAMNPPTGVAAGYGEGQGVEHLRENFARLVSPNEARRALIYPSSNRWILDQMALWFTLGHLVGLRYRDFQRRDVIQNGEFLLPEAGARTWVLCHYFNQNMSRLDAWLRGERFTEALVV